MVFFFLGEIMKWFKHDSVALKDEKIQSLMNEYGACAYVIYFGLCELCAEKIDKNLNPSIKIDWHYAEQLLHSKRTTIKKVMRSCAEANLLETDANDKLLVCKIPNLLKRLDNWTRDLVVATKQLPSKEEEQEEEVKKENKSNPVFIEPTLEEVQEYFEKDLNSSKDKALRFYQFYGSKDWFVGKNKMKKWRLAAARSLTWGETGFNGTGIKERKPFGQGIPSA